jgi:hypothetical protein
MIERAGLLFEKSGLPLHELGQRIAVFGRSSAEVRVAVPKEDPQSSVKYAGKIRGSLKRLAG